MPTSLPPSASPPPARSGSAPRVARPRPATPGVVLASSALLLALTGAALAHRSFWLAAYLVVAALVVAAPRERLRTLGVMLSYAGIGWCLVEIARVPFGSRVTAVLLPVCAAFVARVWALSTEGARRWARPRWAAGVTAAARPLDEALAAALRRGAASEGAVDAAVVALAAAGPEAIPAGEADRRAFWINVYNALARHAGRGRVSNHRLDVLEVFRTEYEVAGDRLTLDEIEHGLLRDNAASVTAPWGRMSAGDPRRRWAVPLDARVHFALHCGALSCPPVRVYRGEDLDAALEAAALGFLAAESAIDEAAGVVETSRLLSWYARDFGGEAGVRALLARALEVDEARIAVLRVRYRSYDWTSSG